MPSNISVPGAVAIAILVVLVLIVIVRNIYIVQQSRAYVVERLGAFHSVWGVRLMRVMQIMQVMQYLFSHTRAYILKRRGGRGIMFSYNPLVFLPFGRFPVSANVASNCMRCFWVSSASRLLPRGIDR